MVCGQNDQSFVQPNSSLHLLEEFLQSEIQPQHLVHHLLAVSAIGMPDVIGGRKTYSQYVCKVVGAELVRFHGLQGNTQGHFIGKRGAPKIIIKFWLWRPSANSMGKNNILSIPFAFYSVWACIFFVEFFVSVQTSPLLTLVTIGKVTAVPLCQPFRRGFHIVSAGNKISTQVLIPVSGISSTTCHENGGTIL